MIQTNIHTARTPMVKAWADSLVNEYETGF